MRRLALALGLALLAGCGAEETPDRPAEPEERPAEGAADAPPTVQIGRMTSAQLRQPTVLHWDALRIRYDEVERHIAAGKLRDDPWVEYTLGLGERAGVSFVAVRGQVEAPPKPIDEVFVLVEGTRGLAVIDGKPQPITNGSILFLPAGARGALTAAQNDPLLFLRIGAAPPGNAAGVRAAPAGDKRRGWVMSFEEFAKKVDEAQAVAGRSKVKKATFVDIEAVPGRLSVHAHSVPFMVKGNAGNMLPITTVPQKHERHDQVLLILHGHANLGVGSSPNRVMTGSVAFIPAGLTWYLQNDDMNAGTLALSVYGPAFDPADVVLDEEPPAEDGAAGDAGRGPK